MFENLNIRDGLLKAINASFEKGGEPTGTIKEWGGKKFMKRADGKWRPVRKTVGAAAQEEHQSSPPKEESEEKPKINIHIHHDEEKPEEAPKEKPKVNIHLGNKKEVKFSNLESFKDVEGWLDAHLNDIDKETFNRDSPKGRERMATLKQDLGVDEVDLIDYDDYWVLHFMRKRGKEEGSGSKTVYKYRFTKEEGEEPRRKMAPIGGKSFLTEHPGESPE